MGFEGTSVTPQIKKLIQEDYLGSILLSAKNLKSKTKPLAADIYVPCIVLILSRCRAMY